MIDKDFEMQAELLTNDGYFTRYREHLAKMKCRAAWEATESELPLGLTRFSTYDSFKKALRQERTRSLSYTVRFQYIIK